MTTTRWKVDIGKKFYWLREETETQETLITAFKRDPDEIDLDTLHQIVREHNEFARVEKAYMDATTREVILQEKNAALVEALEKIAAESDMAFDSVSDISAQGRTARKLFERIGKQAQAALRMAKGG